MLALLLALAAVPPPVLPSDTSGLLLTVDLKIIMQTAMAGLLVWLLSVMRDARAKAAAGVTKIAVLEEAISHIKADVTYLRTHVKNP